MTISLLEGGVWFSYVYNVIDESFTLSINTTTLPGIGTYVLHLNVTWSGSPFYQSVGSKAFTVTVVLRSTQLTHLSFAPGQWGNNVSIEFIYTDLIAGSSAGMTGTLALNASLSGWYTVSYLGNGHYLVVLNTSGVGTDGLYTLNASIVHSSGYYQSALETFGFSVLQRSTQFGYESPDPTPYLENVTLVVTYTDDSTGRGIEGASVAVTCSNTTAEVLALNTNYWVTYLGDGQYLIELVSDALGAPGKYILQISVDYTGPPYYLPAVRSLTARVTQRTTQIVITQTPSDTPFLENITFRFRFEDFLTGAFVVIDKSHITLSHGIGHTLITSAQYSFYNYVTYYEISFNSTVLDAANLVTGHEIQLEIDISAGPPYYAVRSKTTIASTTYRPTQILFPLVQEIPYYDNITIELEYIDFLTGAGIEGATILLDSINWTAGEYQVIELGSGAYRILINSTEFGATGVVFFDFTASKAGVPFPASRQAINVPASIREIQTSFLAQTPSPGSTAVGVPIIVTLTLSDFDHGVPMEGATITTDWTILYGTNYNLAEVGNGVYTLTLNMTGLIAQDYPFTVEASKQFYETASILISVTPGASTFTIQLERTTVYALWGEIAEIRLDVRESYYLSLVPGANVTLFWNGVYYDFDDRNNGTYILSLDTSNNNFGIYEPQISVSRQYYQTRQTSITLVVSKAPGQILSEQTVFNIVVDTARTFTVYLNDTIRNAPVIATSITMEWNNTVYILVANGTPGYYNATIDTSGFDIGPYQAVISAAATNHQFLDATIDINIIPIPTSINLVGEDIALFIIRGEQLTILVEYHNLYYGGYVPGANVTYTIANLTGLLDEEFNGTYSMTIDTSHLPAQTLSLRIQASAFGYAIASRSIPVTILPVPTTSYSSHPLESGYHNEEVVFTFYYNNTYANQPVTGALIQISWEGGSGVWEELGFGWYNVTITLTPTSPRPYDVRVTFSRQDFATSSTTVRVQILATPTHMIAPQSVSVPVNDTVYVSIEILSDLDNSTVYGFNGIAFWTTRGEFELGVYENGTYYFEVPGFLPMGLYTIEIAFSTTIYDIDPLTIEVTVRPVATELRIIPEDNIVIDTYPGQSIPISVLYFDLDHSLGISGADIQVSVSEGNITYLDQFTTESQGVYYLTFVVNAERTFTVTITLTKDQYMTGQIVITIRSDISGQQILARNMALIGGFAFIFLAAFIVVYVRILSVPKMIRILNKMIRIIAGGKVPKAPKVVSRHESVLAIVNEELESVHIKKIYNEVTGEPIEAIVPEVNELLERLAEITGLGEVELDAFRQDLARMKASERPGFIREVIMQEEARRADDLAKKEAKEVEVPRKETLETMPSELEELRMKLKKKGMSDDEIDIIIDQAKTLSKADLEALLDSLGIRL